MFAASAMPVERPVEYRSNSYHNLSHYSAGRSAQNSPATSRRSSVSSIASIQTDPGALSGASRQSSATSTSSTTSTKSGFRGFFNRKEKKPKEKQDVEKIILTSKHAAAVKTKLIMDDLQRKNKKPVKTAGITSSVHTAHLSAAQQEARHPHSGPPAMHAKSDLPLLTRIVSGDERDEEDEFDKLERARLEWNNAKRPDVLKIHEHESDESTVSSAEQSADDDGGRAGSLRVSSAGSANEKVFSGAEARRPPIITKNSYGGRFHRDQNGHWTR